MPPSSSLFFSPGMAKRSKSVNLIIKLLSKTANACWLFKWLLAMLQCPLVDRAYSGIININTGLILSIKNVIIIWILDIIRNEIQMGLYRKIDRTVRNRFLCQWSLKEFMFWSVFGCLSEKSLAKARLTSHPPIKGSADSESDIGGGNWLEENKCTKKKL